MWKKPLRTVGLSEFFGMITGAYTVYSVAQGLIHDFCCISTFSRTRTRKCAACTKACATLSRKTHSARSRPLIEEQRAIVAHIDDASQKIEDGIAIKERQIAALKEYKTSLMRPSPARSKSFRG